MSTSDDFRKGRVKFGLLQESPSKQSKNNNQNGPDNVPTSPSSNNKPPVIKRAFTLFEPKTPNANKTVLQQAPETFTRSFSMPLPFEQVKKFFQEIESKAESHGFSAIECFKCVLLLILILHNNFNKHMYFLICI